MDAPRRFFRVFFFFSTLTRNGPLRNENIYAFVECTPTLPPTPLKIYVSGHEPILHQTRGNPEALRLSIFGKWCCAANKRETAAAVHREIGDPLLSSVGLSYVVSSRLRF